MRIAVTVALAAVAAFVPAPAHAAGPPPGEGIPCGFASVQNPFDPSGTRHAGEIDAGPLVIADGADLRSGRIVCSIQLNAAVHSAPDAVVVRSVTTAGAVWLPATPFEYAASPTDWFSLCTHVEIDGGDTWYYDGDSSTWVTDPTRAWCAVAIETGPEPTDPVDVLLDAVRALACPAVTALCEPF